MIKSIPKLTVLVAPAGYGKTHYISSIVNNWEGLKVQFDQDIPNAASFFANFSKACQSHSIPTVESQDPSDWYQLWNEFEQPFLITLDNWQDLQPLNEVKQFFDYLIRHWPKSMYLVVGSCCQPKLPIAPLCASDQGRYLDTDFLKLSPDEAQQLWAAADLAWEAEEQQFFEHSRGWPLGMMLFRKFRQERLSEDAFLALLLDSIKDVFVNISYDLASLLEPFNTEGLKEWGLEQKNWLPLWKDIIFKESHHSPQKWLYQATESNDPIAKELYLERAFQLCQSDSPNYLLLSIQTQRAQMACILGKFNQIDVFLSEAENYFEKGRVIDKAHWLYLKTQRACQLYQHSEAKHWSQQLLNMKVANERISNLQTQSRIILSLCALQKGQYSEAQELAQAALILAEADQNDGLILQIRLLLTLCQNDKQLPIFQLKEIMKEIEQFSFDIQAWLWINMGLLLLINVNAELAYKASILQNLQECQARLKWNSLKPWIANLEADYYRQSEQTLEAIEAHEKALKSCENHSYMELFSYLNYAKTALRLKQSERLQELLTTAKNQAQKFNAVECIEPLFSFLNVPKLMNDFQQI